HRAAAGRADRDRHVHLRSAVDVDRPADSRPEPTMTLGAPNLAVETPIHVPRAADGLLVGEAAEERVSVATQRQLMWWRFRKHRLALVATAIVLAFYAAVILAGFLAYADPEASDAQRGLIAPQPIYWFDDTGFHPYVLGLTGRR